MSVQAGESLVETIQGRETRAKFIESLIFRRPLKSVEKQANKPLISLVRFLTERNEFFKSFIINFFCDFHDESFIQKFRFERFKEGCKKTA